MQEQTLGRRIQEGRKAAGLSQESLGERLGVSRQAVSKWEADTSVPELENLIAMSRVFGVTIGALLGVEPEAAECHSEADAPESPGEGMENAAPSPGELTDRELAAVEAIVRKYLEAARRPRWSRRRKVLAGAAVCGALILAVLALGRNFSTLGNRLDQVQSQVYGIESSVSSQIESLTGQIRDILDADSNLFAASQARVTDYDLTAETVTLQVSAQAKSWQTDTTAVFTALLSDGRQFSAEAAGENGIFTARDWVLPMDQQRADAGSVISLHQLLWRRLPFRSGSHRGGAVLLPGPGDIAGIVHSRPGGPGALAGKRFCRNAELDGLQLYLSASAGGNLDSRCPYYRQPWPDHLDHSARLPARPERKRPDPVGAARQLEARRRPEHSGMALLTADSKTPRSSRSGALLFRLPYFISSYMTALMVCIRFSASSKTMEAGDSNTSSVTSMASRPNFSPISLPTLVLWSW